MDATTSEVCSKRVRKTRLFINPDDLCDLDALFEDSGSEYNPESDNQTDRDENITSVSNTFLFLLGYVGYHVLTFSRLFRSFLVYRFIYNV